MFSNLIKLSALAILLNASASLASPLKVAVSITPEKYFVEQIGRKHVDVSVIVPPGASPATYSPTANQMNKLAQTKLYFSIGVPFENAWLPRIADVNPQLKITPIYQRICFRAWPSSVADDHPSTETKPTVAPACRPEHPDPHIWMSPPLVRIMAGTIRDTLMVKDPAHRVDYLNNYHAFINQIDQLDQHISKTLAPAALGKSFMVYHPAFGYFARAYGLHQLPVEHKGTEPSPKALAEVIAQAKADKIKVIFVQPQFSQKAAQVIAEEIHGRVVAVNPLAEDWARNMKIIAQAFADAFQ
jgi:zinc transport system substrate-binding protein